jgi:hypothetical protein
MAARAARAARLPAAVAASPSAWLGLGYCLFLLLVIG